MREGALRYFIFSFFLSRRLHGRGSGRHHLAERHFEAEGRVAKMLQRGANFFLSEVELKLFGRGDLEFVVDERGL